jgi:hypothetical protein
MKSPNWFEHIQLSAEKPLTKITVYCHLQRKNKKLSTAFANACTSARLEQTVC